MTEARSELEMLLPFYVNGTLSEEEREAVEAELAQDPELRAALEDTRLLYAEMQAMALPQTTDTGFARIMKAIETTPQTPFAPARQSPPVPTAGTRRSSLLKLALAASLVALLVQGLVFWRSDPTVNLASGDAEDTLIVAFRPDATEGDIRRLLMELDLQIVSGPSSIGLYRLKGDGSTAVVKALSDRADVVESAENAMD